MGSLRSGHSPPTPLKTAFLLFLMASWGPPSHQPFLSSICLRKNCQNRSFWPPKPLPKPIPKRLKIDVQKTYRFLLFFERCSFKFQTFETWKISIFLKGKSIFFRFSQKCVFAFGTHFGCKKNLPKTLRKWRLNALKIDVKNVLFFNVVFFASWPRFWSHLGPKLEPSWSFWPSKMAYFCEHGATWAKKSPQDASRVPKWRPKAPQERQNDAKSHPKSAKMKPKGAPRPPKKP